MTIKSIELPFEGTPGVEGGILRWRSDVIRDIAAFAFRYKETVNNGDGTYTHTYVARNTTANPVCPSCDEGITRCRCGEG